MPDETKEPRVFRTKAEQIASHYYVTIFSAKASHLTFVCLGELTMDEHDYPQFKEAFRAEHLMKGERHGKN